MSTTPQESLKWILLPRISVKQLLSLIFFIAVICWAGLRAQTGAPWALALIVAFAGLVLFFLIGLVFAVGAWATSWIIVSSEKKRGSNPFADGQLPPVQAAVKKDAAQ